MSFHLRGYQSRAVAAIARRFATDQRTLCVLATGGGKTVVFSHVAAGFAAQGKRVMVIAHRDELIRQAAAKIARVTGTMPAIEKADERSDESGMWGRAGVVVASIQTLCSGPPDRRRYRKFKPAEFGLVVVDECFPAGTLVDGKPIEKIEPFQLVRCYNHATRRIERRRILNVMRSRPSAIVRVTLESGRSIHCTPGHRFFTFRGYVPAAYLTPDDRIFSGHQESKCSRDGVSGLREDVRADQRATGKFLPPLLLSGLQAGMVEDEAKKSRQAVHDLRGTGRVLRRERAKHAAKGACVLLGVLHEGSGFSGESSSNGEDKSEVCIGQNEGAEPDEQSGRTGTNEVEANWPNIPIAGRQWHADKTAGRPIESNWPANGTRDRDEVCEGSVPVAAHRLQGRSCRRIGEAGNRGGRQHAQAEEMEVSRPAKDRGLGSVGVDRVEVLEPTGDGRFGGVCPDGFVYNIEVEGNHNYFADGCLVHNCHHAVADTYREAVDYFTEGNPACKVLFVTATPDRADGTGLGEVCQSSAFVFDLRDLIDDGYLVPIRQRSVLIEGLDFAAVRTVGGDLNQGDLETAMMLEKPLHGIAHATIESACDLTRGTLAGLRESPSFAAELSAALEGKRRRCTLVFTVTVNHAKAMSEIFNRWIPGSSDSIDGAMNPDKRKAILASYKAGRIQFLVNVMVATEGFDEPRVEMVVMARPTKSRALAVQMTGRGTRPADDIAARLGDIDDAAGRRAMIAASAKSHMTVLDFVGNSGQHKLMTVADVLGGVRYEDAVLARAAELAAELAADGLPEIDAEQVLEEAAADVELDRAAERMRAEQAAADLEDDERMRAEQAAKRANLRATADYTVTERDPFDQHDLVPARDAGVSGGGASEPQINYLVRLGVRRETACGYSKRQASAVISKLKNQDAQRSEA